MSLNCEGQSSFLAFEQTKTVLIRFLLSELAGFEWYCDYIEEKYVKLQNFTKRQ